MNKVKIMVWGREFDLGITYDCYSGEEVLDIQKKAVDAFVKSEKVIADSLEQVKKYFMDENGTEIGAAIDNIFKYVAPKYLYVSRDDKKHIVSLMCNYKFDPENGIAIVFENEKFSKIGRQDVIL